MVKILRRGDRIKRKKKSDVLRDKMLRDAALLEQRRLKSELKKSKASKSKKKNNSDEELLSIEELELEVSLAKDELDIATLELNKAIAERNAKNDELNKELEVVVVEGIALDKEFHEYRRLASGKIVSFDPKELFKAKISGRIYAFPGSPIAEGLVTETSKIKKKGNLESDKAALLQEIKDSEVTVSQKQKLYDKADKEYRQLCTGLSNLKLNASADSSVDEEVVINPTYVAEVVVLDNRLEKCDRVHESVEPKYSAWERFVMFFKRILFN